MVSSAALSEIWRLYLMHDTEETPVTVCERHGYIPRVHAQHLHWALLPVISEGTLGEQKIDTLIVINLFPLVQVHCYLEDLKGPYHEKQDFTSSRF